jgi:chromosome segregation ATPase
VLIEQAMYFALGLLVAGLFMLMFLPAFWRRAMRLSMRRLQMLAPLSREQAIAERDLLRAEFALRERRLEQEMDAIKASKAQDLTDLGRHAARIADLDRSLKKSEAHGRELATELAETRKTLAERTELLGSTEMALHEVTEAAERTVATLRMLRSHHEELGREKEVVQTRVAAHEAKIGDLHQQNTDLQRALTQLREDFAKLKTEAERLGGVDALLTGVVAQFEATTAAKLSLEDALDALRARGKEDGERLANEIAHLETALRQARAEAREHADRLETARADNSMLQGAVEALRKDHARLRDRAIQDAAIQDAASQGAANQDAAEAAPLNARDLAALRREIANLAARMLEEPPAAPPRERESAPAKRAL